MPSPPRQSDKPEPGHYLMKLIRNGPWVAAQIVIEDDQWSVMIDGAWSGPSADPWLLPDMERVHWYGRPSTEAETKYRIGVKRWAEIHKPDHPAANPKSPILLDKLRPPI